MATARSDWFSWLLGKPDRTATKQPKRAYEFAVKVHRATGGPTPDLMRLQRALAENGRKLQQARRGSGRS